MVVIRDIEEEKYKKPKGNKFEAIVYLLTILLLFYILLRLGVLEWAASMPVSGLLKK